MKIEHMDIRNLSDKDLLLTENREGMPILIYKTKGKNNDIKIKQIPLLRKNGIEFTPQTLRMIKSVSKNGYGNIYCELEDDHLITSLNRYTDVPIKRTEEEQEDPIATSKLDLNAMSPEQLAQLAAVLQQQKAQQFNNIQRDKKISTVASFKGKKDERTGLYGIGSDDIWVTDQEGRPEILYGGAHNEILSMPLQNENGEYNEEALKLLRITAKDRNRRIYFDLASEKLGKDLEMQTGFKIPLKKNKNIAPTISKNNSDDSLAENSKTISTFSLVNISEDSKVLEPTIVTEYSDGTLEYTPMLKEDNTLNSRAVSAIENYLSQEGMNLSDALKLSKINVQLSNELVETLHTALDTYYKEEKQDNSNSKVFLLEDKQRSNDKKIFLLEDKQLRQESSLSNASTSNVDALDKNLSENNLLNPESINTENAKIDQNQRVIENSKPSSSSAISNPEVQFEFLEAGMWLEEPVCRLHSADFDTLTLPLEGSKSEETYYIIDYYLKQNGITTIKEAIEQRLIIQNVFASNELLEEVEENLVYYQTKSLRLTKIHITNDFLNCKWDNLDFTRVLFKNIYRRDDTEVEFEYVHRLIEENQPNKVAFYYITHLLTSNNMSFEEALESGLIKDQLLYAHDKCMENIKATLELYQEGRPGMLYGEARNEILSMPLHNENGEYNEEALKLSKINVQLPNELVETLHTTPDTDYKEEKQDNSNSKVFLLEDKQRSNDKKIFLLEDKQLRQEGSLSNASASNIDEVDKNLSESIYNNISSVMMSGTFEDSNKPSALNFLCTYPDNTYMKFTLFSSPQDSDIIVNIDSLNNVLKNSNYETFIDAYNNGFIEVSSETELQLPIDAIFYVHNKLEEYRKEIINLQSESSDNNEIDNSTFANKVLSVELSYFDTEEEKAIPTCRFNYEDYHSPYIKLRYDGVREFHDLLQQNNLNLTDALANEFVYPNSEVSNNILEDILSKIEEELKYCEYFPIDPINNIKIVSDWQKEDTLNLEVYYGDESIRSEFNDCYYHPLNENDYYIMDTFDYIDRFLLHKGMSFDKAIAEGLVTFDDHIATEEIKNIKEIVENYRNIIALSYTPKEKEMIKRKLQERKDVSKQVMKILSVQNEDGFNRAKIMPASSKSNPYNIAAEGILLYTNTGQYQPEAIACIDEILKDQNVTFEEALEQGIIKVDNNPELEQVVEELKLEYSEETKVLSIKIEQFTGENSPKAFISYNDGSTGHFNMLTEDGKDNEETLNYIEQILQEQDLSYEEARSSKFIDFIPRKALSKVVAYEFEEPMHTDTASLQLLNLSNQNAIKTRTVKQACVFYKDGSFKNILLEQREPQPDGKELVYRFNDNLINEIEDSTGIRMTLNDIKNLEKVEECTGQEFENNFSKYLEEVKNNSTINNNSKKKKNLINKITEKTGDLTQKIGKGTFKLIKKSVSGITKTPNFKCTRESKSGVMKESFSRFLENSGIGDYLSQHKSKCKNLVIYTAGALAIAAVIAVTGKIIYNGLGLNVIKENEDNISKQKEAVKNTLDVSLFSDMTAEEAIAALPNGQIKAMEAKHWNYINYYNSLLGDQSKEEGKTSRLAITYDNVKAEYLGYNADLLQQKNINILYGNYKISSDDLKSNLSLGHEEDMMAYVISKEEIDKSALFKTEDGQYFHHKYAKIIAEIVSANNPNQKAKAVDKFRQFTTEEIAIIQKEFAESGRVPSYKLSLIPILDAAEFICERDQLKPILTEEQRTNFKNIAINQTDTYFNELTGKLNAVQLTETKEQLSIYEIFKEKVEKELTKQDLYNISNRDIRDHSEFIIEREEEKTTENIEIVMNDTTTEHMDVKATKTVYYTDKTYTSATDPSEVTTVAFTAELDTNDNREDFEVADQNSKEIEITETIDQEKTDILEKATAEQAAEAIRQTYQQEQDQKKENIEQDIKKKNDEYQKNLEPIKEEKEISKKTLGTDTKILEGYQDQDGNLENFVENLTTNSTDINKSLPLLNEEKQDKNEHLEYAKEGTYYIVESETDITIEKLAEEAINNMTQEKIVTATREAKSK